MIYRPLTETNVLEYICSIKYTSHHLPKEHAMANPIVHWEIAGRNAAKLQEFYGEVFDWKINSREEMGGYRMVETV